VLRLTFALRDRGRVDDAVTPAEASLPG